MKPRSNFKFANDASVEFRLLTSFVLFNTWKLSSFWYLFWLVFISMPIRVLKNRFESWIFTCFLCVERVNKFQVWSWIIHKVQKDKLSQEINVSYTYSDFSSKYTDIFGFFWNDSLPSSNDELGSLCDVQPSLSPVSLPKVRWPLASSLVPGISW